MMKKISYLFLTLAMVITAGMTAASCSVNDNPSTPQNSALAEALVGEWIDEYDYDGTGDLFITTIYHFYDDGTCWKELNLMQDNEVVDEIVSRYDTGESTYTIDASGRVLMTVKNAEKDADESEVLTFDGTHLSVTYAVEPVTLVRATDAQIQFYQAEADAWHGGNAGNTGEAEGHPLSESVLGKPLIKVTEADLGKIIGSDGKIYDRFVDALVAHVSPLAMIAYVGSDTDHPTYQNGLAISLFDDGLANWSIAYQICNSNKRKVPAGAKWVLPSKKQWTNMLLTGGGSIQNDGNNLKDCGWLNKALSSVPGRALNKIYEYDDFAYEYDENYAYYWVSDVIKATDSDKNNGNSLDSGFLLYIYDDHAEFSVTDLYTKAVVRACLVF